MPPADPPQSATGAAVAPDDPHEADEAELAEEARAPDPRDLEALWKRRDVESLLALAKACRSGTAAGGRDMDRCLEAYRAAAQLGSAEADFAVALFYMNGSSALPQDLKEGTMRLRSAAEKGSVPAKVYLGNLYELGIHYKADAEKADVWYRNAGRGAKIDAEQGSDEWNRALAELGSARHFLALTDDPAVDETEKARLLVRAKAHGYALRVREEASEGDRATFVNALGAAESAVPTETPPPVAVTIEPRERKDTSPETTEAKRRAKEKTDPRKPMDPAARAAAEKAERAAKKQAADASARRSVALAAFGYALLFALAGAGAGYAATVGAQELVARGHVLPVLGTSTRLVFPIALVTIGVLPAWLVYKLATVLKALVLGAAGAAVGWVAWGTGQAAFNGDRPLQALAFGLASFLAGLLVLGLIGGAKQPRSESRRR